MLLVAVGAVGTLVWSLGRREGSSQPVRRFTIQPPPSATMVGTVAVVSPDGRYLAYSGQSDRGPQIYVRAMDHLDVRALPGTERAGVPTFSPDGQWVAFVADQKLKKVSLTSGAPPISLADIRGCCAGGSITWLPDGGIIIPLIATGLVRVPDQGGAAVALTTPDAERREIDHHSPSWLPGGKALLIGIHRGAEAFDVAMLRLDTGQRRVLVRDAFEPQYVRTGHLLFVRDDTLFAAPFDADRLELTGPAVGLIEHVFTAPDSGVASYRVSDDGSLVYIPALSLQGRKLVWVDRGGHVEPLPIDPRGFSAPSLSPDGRRLAVQIDEGSRRDIWIYDFATEALARATFDGASDAPTWTPDGKRLVFSSTKDGRRQIYWQPADGTGQPELLVADEHSVWAGNWSPDGRTLAYTRQPPTDRNDIGLLRLTPSPKADLIISSDAPEQFPRISPDGKWLAYAAWEAGQTQGWDVYVMGLPVKGGKRQVSIDGGGRPVWRRDGRELFYRRGSQFMVVSTDSLPGGLGKPRPLPMPVRAAQNGRTDFYGPAGYDVSLDGERLLIVQETDEESASRRIHIVLNWHEELKRRVPTR
jgi:serine/threonine-protein kinase